MDQLFSNLEVFKDNIALTDSSGECYTYGQLMKIGAEQISLLGSHRFLIGIEASSDVISLSTYISALRAGHSIILGHSGALSPGSRIYKTFKPSYVFRYVNDEWHMDIHNNSACSPPHKDLAVLLPTSGSTGEPKLVRLSHQNILSNAKSIVKYLNIKSDEGACMTLPWSYSYGMSIIHSHLESGAKILFCSHSVSETAFWEYFKKHGATSFAGVPYTYELIERTDFFQDKLPTLRYFTQAGGRLDPSSVKLFADYARVHEKKFYVMYGQTEAAPRMAYMPPESIMDHPDCIGIPIPGGRLKIIDSEGREVEEHYRNGELVYSGDNVMMGYATSVSDLQRGNELNELVTGDLAFRNKDGFFKIVGRTKRFLKLFGLRLSLDDIENVLKEHRITSVVTGDDNRLVVAILHARDRDKINELIKNRFKLPLSVISIVEFNEFPLLPSNKVDYREILKVSLESGENSISPQNKTVGGLISEIVDEEKLDKEGSFISAGGDSFNYIRVSIWLEENLGYVPNGWETMSIRELESLKPRKMSRWQRIDTDILVRALCITLIVCHHVSTMKIGNSALSLYMLAGYNFARFQIPKLCSGKGITTIKPILSKIIPLYFTAITIYFIVKQTFFLPQYLLVSNFTQGLYLNGVKVLTTWWFIETYALSIVLFTLLFCLPKIQKGFKNDPWNFSLQCLGTSLILRGLGELFPECNLFYSNTPFMLASIFIAGWCIYLADSMKRRIFIMTFIVSIMHFSSPNSSIVNNFLFIGACLAIVWFPSIPVDKIIGKILLMISASSFYIYIGHGFVIHSMRSIIGGNITPIYWPVTIVLCVISGILLWKVIERKKMI